MRELLREKEGNERIVERNNRGKRERERGVGEDRRDVKEERVSWDAKRFSATYSVVVTYILFADNSNQCHDNLS